jgi:hypothetical protein
VLEDSGDQLAALCGIELCLSKLRARISGRIGRVGGLDVLTMFLRDEALRVGGHDLLRRFGAGTTGSVHSLRLDATDPISVVWTLHALDKARQLGFARQDVEEALLGGHRERRRNKGGAAWLLTAGPLVIAYEHPDQGDPLAVRIVTIWRRR